MGNRSYRFCSLHCKHRRDPSPAVPSGCLWIERRNFLCLCNYSKELCTCRGSYYHLIAIKAKFPVTKVLGYSLILASVCFIIYILMPTQTLILALCIVFYMVSALCIMSTWALQFVPVSEVEIPMVVTRAAQSVLFRCSAL